MSGEEHANGARRSSVFPPEWGIPEGSTYSEERAAWVKARVALHTRMRPIDRLIQLDRKLRAQARLDYVRDLG